MKKTLLSLLILTVCTLALISCTNIQNDGALSDEATHTHTFGDWAEIKFATCNSEGERARLCYCGEIESYSIPRLAHTETVIPAVAATCSSEGLTEGVGCSVCDTIITPQQTVAMAEHTAEIDPAVPSTCISEGLTEGTHCSFCNKVLVEQQTVALADHTAEIDPAVPSTCISEGLTEGTHCSFCNKVLVEQQTVELADHISVTDPAVPSTCITEGLTEGAHCSFCLEVLVEQQTVKLADHVRVIDPAVPATCSLKGRTEGAHCQVCDYVIIPQTSIARIPHEYGEWRILKLATTEAVGTRAHYCTVCNFPEYSDIDIIRNDGTHGSAGYISDTTVIISIFANDKYTSWDFNSASDLSTFNTMYEHLGSACAWLTEQCAKYNTEANFIYDWKKDPSLFYTCSFEEDMVRPDGIYYSTQLEFIEANIDSKAIMQKYNAQNVLYIVYFDSLKTNTVNSWSLSDDQGKKTELVNIFTWDTMDNGIPYLQSASTFAHEILHCFGAKDLYYANVAIPQEYVNYCKKINSKDIMYTVNLGKNIIVQFTDLCAYYIGLIDYCEDVETWGLNRSSYLIK